MIRQKFHQKFCAVVGLLLVLLAWAPMAVADENLIDDLLGQLAVFLGLADESGPSFSPGGFAGPNPLPDGLEMPYNPSPGGFAGEGDDKPEMPYNPSPGG